MTQLIELFKNNVLKVQTYNLTRIFLALILLISVSNIDGQNTIDSIKTRPLNSLNINILGDASIFSAHFEKLFPLKGNFLIAGKLGVGYNEELVICVFGNCSPPEKYFTVPHHITLNYGRKKHFIEVGLGGTLLVGNTEQYLFYPILGYRFLPLKTNKINFRVFGEVPISDWEKINVIFIPFGISVGLSF